MSQMQELYKKVAASPELQEVFNSIVSKKDSNEEDFVKFAKDNGYDVSFEEISGFLKATAPNEQELSQEELDAVAGGKSNLGAVNIAVSIGTLGLYCGVLSIAVYNSGNNNNDYDECTDVFK